MANSRDESSIPAESVAGIVASRRDVLRTATGLAAAAVVGGAVLDRGQTVVAAGPNTSITGHIEGIGTFEVLAFSWGLSNSGSTHVGGGGGAGKASVQDLSLTKYMDTLSPDLVVAVASGKHFPSAWIAVTDKKGNGGFRIDLSEVLVTSVSLGGSGGEILTENVTLNFSAFSMAVGGASGGWNIKENTKL